MIIWAAVGLAGLFSGLITVGAARRRNQPATSATDNGPVDTAAKPASAVHEIPVSPDHLTQAA